MTETKIYCDHCKRELDRMKDYIDIEIDMSHKWQKVDLCEDCYERLWSMIDDFCIGCYLKNL
jgi:hypothetical protein